MKPQDFPDHIRKHLVPAPTGEMVYICVGCESAYGTDTLLYTCPSCGGVLMLQDKSTETVNSVPAAIWREIFDYRRMLNHSPEGNFPLLRIHRSDNTP